MTDCIYIPEGSWGYGKKQNPLFRARNLHVQAGQIVALLGRNGTGKSTLLQSIAGLIPPKSGAVEVMNRDVHRIRPSAIPHILAMVFGHKPQTGELTARDVLALGRAHKSGYMGQLREPDRRAMEKVVDRLGLNPLLHQTYAHLSDGEKQKVLLGRALVQETPVLLLDEPTANLDLPATMELFVWLRELAGEERKAIVFSTHHPDLALQIADIFWLIHNGELWSGSRQEMIDQGRLQEAFGGPHHRFDDATGLGELRSE